jgi:hypothetical protein
MTANARQLLHKTMLLTPISVLKNGFSGGLAGENPVSELKRTTMED